MENYVRDNPNHMWQVKVMKKNKANGQYSIKIQEFSQLTYIMNIESIPIHATFVDDQKRESLLALRSLLALGVADQIV